MTNSMDISPMSIHDKLRQSKSSRTFLDWILSSTDEEIVSFSNDISRPFPFSLYPLTVDDRDLIHAIAGSQGYEIQCENKTECLFKQAALEGELENISDAVSMIQRELIELEETIASHKIDQKQYQEDIYTIEKKILNTLHDREKMVVETHGIRKQIERMEKEKQEKLIQQDKQLSPRQSLYQVLAKATDVRKSPTNQTKQIKMDIERLEKDLVHTKLTTAVVKTELDQYYQHVKELEMEYAHWKLQLAQISTQDTNQDQIIVIK